MEKLTKKNSILYNQLWINKAIEEGYLEFIPVHKIPNKSIGEHIEIKYNQLYNEEFDKNYHNGTLEEYQHTLPNFKVTKYNSRLLEEAIIEDYIKSGISPIRAMQMYREKLVNESLEEYQFPKEKIEDKIESIFLLSGEIYTRKKVKK